jgi:hypothetical protein
MSDCASPLDFAELLEYWLGELPAGREQAVEAHFFACAPCSARLQELAALGASVREVFVAGALRAVISPAFLERLKAAGLRVREYRIRPGGSVNCAVAAADDFVVSRLAAPLAGVKRLDVYSSVEGGPAKLFRDVPFDPTAGEVLVLPAAAPLKKMPTHVQRLRLVAVDDAGERTIGEYTFNHSAA